MKAAGGSHTERRQRARLKLLGYVALFYLFDAVVLALFAWQGVIPLAIAASYVLAAGLLSAAVFLLVCCGWNLRFEDASFTFGHKLASTAVELLFLWLAPEAGLVFLLSLFIIAALASLELSTRQFVAWWALVMAALGVILAHQGHRIGIPTDSSAQLLLVWLAIAHAIGRIVVITARMTALRERLHRRNQELKASFERIEQLANVDDLTQVWNRRALMKRMDEERARCSRTGAPFAIALIDIDRFKSINDSHGHLVGDQLLRAFARRVSERLREVDLLGRYGGEEFILLLVGTRLAGAVRLAERLREDVAAANWDEVLPGLRLTMSAGVAEYRPGESLEALLERADNALYAAKRGGRNRVERAPNRIPEPT